MQRYISPENSSKIEEAVNFLVKKYAESGRNPKPVVLHSLRIGIYLLELGYDIDTIIVAILHDLIEDSDVKISDIKNKFGDNIAMWIEAVSFKSDIEDSTEQYKEMFTRTFAGGKIPVMVKAADLHANSFYYKLAPNLQKQEILIEKMSYFLEKANLFNTEPVIIQLRVRYQEEKNRFISLYNKK